MLVSLGLGFYTVNLNEEVGYTGLVVPEIYVINLLPYCTGVREALAARPGWQHSLSEVFLDWNLPTDELQKLFFSSVFPRQ